MYFNVILELFQMLPTLHDVASPRLILQQSGRDADYYSVYDRVFKDKL